MSEIITKIKVIQILKQSDCRTDINFKNNANVHIAAALEVYQ